MSKHKEHVFARPQSELENRLREEHGWLVKSGHAIGDDQFTILVKNNRTVTVHRRIGEPDRVLYEADATGSDHDALIAEANVFADTGK